MQVTSFQPKESLNLNHCKNNLHSAYLVINNEGKTLIDCRIYWPNQVAYCCVWLMNEDIYASGSGKAGGYGYCKESSCIQYALKSAGVEFDENFAGRGIRATEDALKALGEHLNKGQPVFIKRIHA